MSGSLRVGRRTIARARVCVCMCVCVRCSVCGCMLLEWLALSRSTKFFASSSRHAICCACLRVGATEPCVAEFAIGCEGGLRVFASPRLAPCSRAASWVRCFDSGVCDRGVMIFLPVSFSCSLAWPLPFSAEGTDPTPYRSPFAQVRGASTTHTSV